MAQAPVIAFYPALVPLTGDHASATVLSQIIYWHQGRLRVRWNGQYWLAKSREEMCEETAITLQQYKRIMPALAEQGWVQLERHLFNGQVTPFIRLTPKGVETANRLVSIPSIRLESNDANDQTKNTTKITTEMANEEHSPERGGSVIGGGLASGKGEREQIKREKREEEKVRENGDGMKADDVLKARKTPDTSNLGAFWKSRCALVSEAYQRPLTGKELAQLKQLSKYLGPQTKDVITYAVEHWWKFASRAGASGGTSFPADPSIGFLLKFHHVAVNLLSPSTGAMIPPTPTVSAESPPMQLSASGEEPEEPYQPTPEELAELLDGLKLP